MKASSREKERHDGDIIWPCTGSYGAKVQHIPEQQG